MKIRDREKALNLLDQTIGLMGNNTPTDSKPKIELEMPDKGFELSIKQFEECLKKALEPSNLFNNVPGKWRQSNGN